MGPGLGQPKKRTKRDTAPSLVADKRSLAVGFSMRQRHKTKSTPLAGDDMDDAAPSFDEFYALYPRKVSRMDGLKAWNTLTNAQRKLAIQHIPRHTAKWLAEGQETSFIPYPATWLRGYRWEDEIEIAPPKTANWRQSEELTLAMAQKVGVNPLPGEDYNSLRNRITAKLVRVA